MIPDRHSRKPTHRIMASIPLPPANDALEITRRTGDGPARLSFAQELLWLMDQASPGLSAWNLPRAFRMRGDVDGGALQHALDQFVARHEMLRTLFVGPESAPRQVVQPAAPVPLERIDLRNVPAERRDAELDALVKLHARTPFDLARDLPFRALLITVGDRDQMLCLNTPHIVFDGWSKALMLRELSQLYDAAHRGVAADLPPLPIQFVDYAEWERSAGHEAALAEPLAFWREQLAGPLPNLNLPIDRPRPSVLGFERGQHNLVLPPSLYAAMEALAREQGVTPYMMLMAAYVTLLHRYTGQDDIIVGSPSAGRDHTETEGLVGYFVNTLVLRNRVTPDLSFADLLASVRDTALNAYEHQEVPFEKLVLELQKGQQLSHAPIFQTVMTMEDTFPAALKFDGVDVEMLEAELGATKFDLTLMIAKKADGLRLSLWYRTDLHQPATAERMLRHLQAILERAIENPSCAIGDIPLLNDAEHTATLSASTGAPMRLDATPVHERTTAVAQRNPNRVAVTSGAHALTYGELDRRSNQVAHRLRTLGVERGATVGLSFERSVDAVVGLVGILKAGAAYVPLSPELPPARLATQAEEAGLRVAVTLSGSRDRLPSHLTMLLLDADADAIGSESDEALASPVTASDLAYVLFTSGSTGTPKGVAVTHGNIAQYTSAIVERLGIGLASGAAPIHFATVSTLAADLGNTSIYPALTTGGTLHVVPVDVATDASRFGDYVAAQPIDVLKITPNHLRALLSGPHGDAVLPLRWLILGGEASGWDLTERVLRAGACRVLNHYGPTESTVGCCTFEVTTESSRAARDASAQTVPIGRPLPNVSTYVVDGRGHLVPPGVAGELWVGGAGVARGYLNRDDLTAERFGADPFAAGARVYHTGDLVRRLGTGDLEFIGRIDNQVKVRGYRVELGEIEQLLAAHPGVAHAVALVRDGGAPAAEPMLVVYVVAKSSGYAAAHAERATPESLKAHIAERLPEYMVPAAIVLLDALPLGANGKLDRAALPSPEATEAVAESIAPRTETEAALAQIWRDVLKREQVGVHDNFLALGGHSLLAIRTLGRISKQLGARLPLRALFEAPTIAELGARIDAELNAKADELQRSLAAIEQMSDDQVTRALGGDGPGPEAR